MRLELTQANAHYPLKVACLPFHHYRISHMGTAKIRIIPELTILFRKNLSFRLPEASTGGLANAPVRPVHLFERQGPATHQTAMGQEGTAESAAIPPESSDGTAALQYEVPPVLKMDRHLLKGRDTKCILPAPGIKTMHRVTCAYSIAVNENRAIGHPHSNKGPPLLSR